MLLSVETVNLHNNVVLDIWEVGGKQRIVKPPFQPYFYSLKEVRNGKPVIKRLLSDLTKKTTIWKVEFPNTQVLEMNTNEYSIEDNVPFNQRIAIDTGFYCPSPWPKLMAWDAESIGRELSADPYHDIIRSLGTWGKSKEDRQFTKGDPKKTIETFIKTVKVRDPDILVDYYGRFYDVPLLLSNGKRLRIRCKLGRDGSEPYIVKRSFERRGRGRKEQFIRIAGRVHFDVHKEVEADYSLTRAGLKSRSLNEVAQHYGLNPITGVDHGNIPEDRLEEVNLDDARCTYEIANVYLSVLFELAEYLSVPLNMIIDRSPSHIPNYIYGREYAKRGIVSDKSNQDRFPELFKKGCKAHQGAYNVCFETGLFRKVRHWDYASFYACCMIAFNLDPETVQLLEVKEHTGEYHFENHDDYAIVEVPDVVEDQFSRQVVCKIDLSLDSVSRLKLKEILAKRRDLKKDYRKTGNQKSYSRSIALKLVGNLCWGYQSMRHSRWGSVPVGVLIAALARYIIQKTTEARNAKIIQVSTDGWYETKYQDEKLLDLTTILPDCFDITAFKTSYEDYDGMLSIDKKDYVLFEKGKVKKYGSGLLGKHQPRICDFFVDDFCLALYNGESTGKALQKYVDLRGFPTDDFVITVKVSKNPTEYQKTTMYAALVKQFTMRGIELRWGDKLQYIKTTVGYRPVQFLTANHKIDYAYYKERLATVAARINGGKAKDYLRMLKNQSLEMFR